VQSTVSSIVRCPHCLNAVAFHFGGVKEGAAAGLIERTRALPALPMEPQHRNILDFAGVLDRCPATRSATSAATHRVGQQGESGQCDRDLWPGGNTAPETTLLGGYGVDTLRWADNVAAPGSRRGGCPGEFQRGLTRRGKGAASGWGTSPTLLPRGLGPARLARSNSIHAVGRLIVETSWAICSFPAHVCEQGITHSAASPADCVRSRTERIPAWCRTR
jgi:hypothetical protein